MVEKMTGPNQLAQLWQVHVIGPNKFGLRMAGVRDWHYSVGSGMIDRRD